MSKPLRLVQYLSLLFICNSSQAQTLPEDHPLCIKRSDIERFANAWADEDNSTIRRMAPFCTVTKRPVAASVLKRDGDFVQVLVNTGKDSAPLWTIRHALRP